MFKDFIMQNWQILLAILVLVIVLIALWFVGKKDFVKKVLYFMVCKAEQSFGSGTGEVKFDYVLAQFYANMPLFIRLLFPLPLVKQYIELAVEKLKTELSQGMNLLSYKDEQKIIISVLPAVIPEPSITV